MWVYRNCGSDMCVYHNCGSDICLDHIFWNCLNPTKHSSIFSLPKWCSGSNIDYIVSEGWGVYPGYKAIADALGYRVVAGPSGTTSDSLQVHTPPGVL